MDSNLAGIGADPNLTRDSAEASAASRPGLPREIAGLSQPERILWSMVRVVAEKGSDAVTVADVVDRATVSRSTFYALFDNKEECLFAAYERVIEVLVEYVADAFRTEAPWPVKVRRGLDALLRAYAAEPDVARMATVEVPAAGPEAQRRYRDAFLRFLPFLAEGRDHVADDARLPDDVELMALGGAEAIVFDEVVSGRTSGLPALLPDILFAVLVPYLGPEAATDEMHQAARA